MDASLAKLNTLLHLHVHVYENITQFISLF